jgi:hypothetical protein
VAATIAIGGMIVMPFRPYDLKVWSCHEKRQGLGLLEESEDRQNTCGLHVKSSLSLGSS